MIVNCLSVRNPWAHAIVAGLKPIENRTSGFTKKFRGRLYIASTAGWSERGRNDRRIVDGYQLHDGPALSEYRYALHHCPAYGGRSPHPFVSGRILGHVDVVDIHDEAGCAEAGGLCHPWGEVEYREDEGKVRRNLVHIVMENPVELARPIPVKGRLGIWTFDL